MAMANCRSMVDHDRLLMKQMDLLTLLDATDDRGKQMDAIRTHIREVVSSANPVICTEFSKDSDWINVERPIALEELKANRQIVVLDFFTYCCINCLHILPTLEQLEQSISKHVLTVIGVHSAKFDNEQLLENVENAVRRYEIRHPVVNDGGYLWEAMNISCWPTVLMLAPDLRIVFMLIGENYTIKWAKLFAELLVEHFSAGDMAATRIDQIDSALQRTTIAGTTSLPQKALSFPGKLSLAPSALHLLISDTGNHRLIVTTVEGRVVCVIGGKNGRGFRDGNFEESQFNSPQGSAWSSDLVFFVADTGNHCIRQVDLINGTVKTVAGTGEQGSDIVGGATAATEQPLNSPWDLCLVDQERLFIAMAGSHQIWVLTLDEIEIFGKRYEANRCLAFAGSSAEENRNNSYPHKAAFAQPSGLAADLSRQLLFVADSESSTVRQVNIVTGAVKGLAGGSKNPMDLFVYGDRDGKAEQARLQHPMGVALNDKDGTLFIADSYNHKIKEATVENRDVLSVVGTGQSGRLSSTCRHSELNEPGGLCYSSKLNLLLIADTNNHCVRKVQLDIDAVTELELDWPANIPYQALGRKHSNEQQIQFEGKDLSLASNVTIKIRINCKTGLYQFTEGAPSSIRIEMPERLPFVCLSKMSQIMQSFDGDGVQFELRPDKENEMYGKFSLLFSATLYLCQKSDGICTAKRYGLYVPVSVIATSIDQQKQQELEIAFDV